MYTVGNHTFSGIRALFDINEERGALFVPKEKPSEELKSTMYIPGSITPAKKLEMELAQRYDKESAGLVLRQQLSFALGDKPPLQGNISEAGLKITETKIVLSAISEKKSNLIQRMADKIFKKAEEKGGIILNDSKKSQFKLGLQAAMDVEGIPESQRYTIIGRYAQGFLSESAIEPTIESGSSVDQLNLNRVESIPQESQLRDVNVPIVMTNPELLGRELLGGSETHIDDSGGDSDGEITLGSATQEVHMYNTQVTELQNNLDSYNAEAAIAIENEQGEETKLMRSDILPEQYDSIVGSSSLGDPEAMSNIPEGKTLRVNWADENGATQVQCTHLSDGDFVLSFPDGDRIIIDSNGDNEKAEKEIRLIQEIAKTPIARQLLNMGTGSFYQFRKRVAMRYDPEGKTTDNPELLIKLMLEAILQIAMNGKDNLHSKNADIYSGEFRDPTITLAVIQSRLYGSANPNKRIISEALSEQGIFDIESRRFNTISLMVRI